MRAIILIVFTIFISTTVLADLPTGDEILKKIDQNMFSDSSVTISKMIIHSRRGSRTIESKTWAQGDQKAFTEYLSPAREKGTKMLKLEDRLWTYSPSTDRTIQISGHMLRQSVMGSDLSYEDMMEDEKLSDIYDAKVDRLENVASRSCFVVKLVATKKEVAYQTRTIWVDQERYVPVKEELFAKSGKLLKNITLGDFRFIQNRWYPFSMTFKDVLKNGKGTEFVVDSIKFNEQIPNHIFSKASLRR